MGLRGYYVGHVNFNHLRLADSGCVAAEHVALKWGEGRMKYSADRAEEVAKAIQAQWGCTTDTEMLRDYAALLRLIEGPCAEINKAYATNSLSYDAFTANLEQTVRTLAAALEQERAGSAKLKGDYDGMFECAKAHDAARTKYLLENAELRAVFECARSVLRNNVGGTREHQDKLEAALSDLNDACEAVKLRDSGLADGPMSDAEWSELTKGMREDETINAVQVGTIAHGPRRDEILATEPADVAAPDQEGLADAIIAEIISDIKQRSGLDDAWGEIDVDIRNEITHGWRIAINSALRNSAKPAAEIPEGWQLVPKVATIHMTEVSCNKMSAAMLYKAMLERAPSPPSNRSET